MSRYTKRPWKVSPHSDHEVWANDGTTLVAELPAIGEFGNNQDGEDPDEFWYDPRATANVIAAAPDLLEALKEAVDRMEQVGELVDGRQFIPQCSAAIALAQTAINKAEGR